MKRSERDVHRSDRHGRNGYNGTVSDDGEDSDEPESEEGVDSGDEEEKGPRKHSRNHAKALVEAEASAARKRIDDERKSALISLASNTTLPVSDMSSDDNMSVDDTDVDIRPIFHHADLNSPTGRQVEHSESKEG